MKNLQDIRPYQVLKKYIEMNENERNWEEADKKHFTMVFGVWMTGILVHASTNKPELLKLSLSKTNYLGKKTRALLSVMGMKEPKTLKELKEILVKEYGQDHHMGAPIRD